MEAEFNLVSNFGFQGLWHVFNVNDADEARTLAEDNNLNV